MNLESKPFLLKVLLLTIRTIIRFFRDFEGLVTSAIQKKLLFKLFPPKYQIKGKCQKRGICCKNIGIYLSPTFWEYQWLKGWAIIYYSFVYNFDYIGDDKDHKIILFKCNYLKNNQCSIYNRRPFICRNYPEVRAFTKPTFLPGCGYRL